MFDFTPVRIEKDIVLKSADKVKNNEIISSFYRRMYEESGDVTLQNREYALSSCYRVWNIDKFEKQNVRNVSSIILCHDKFCCNCQNCLSKQRYAIYKPVFEKLSKNFYLYHIVFTVPNVKSDELSHTLNRMYEKFVYIVQYLQGKRKIKGISFIEYGFLGLVRSLEITTKTVGDHVEYHPHFHCLCVFSKPLPDEKTCINEYSFSNGAKKRCFSKFEILMQKIWRLVYDGIRVNQVNIDDTSIGYSLTIDMATKSSYKEVFKYTLKGTFKDESIFSYDVFTTLYSALYRKKIIQGYGVLRKCNFMQDDEKDFSIEEFSFDIVDGELVIDSKISTDHSAIVKYVDTQLADIDEKARIAKEVDEIYSVIINQLLSVEEPYSWIANVRDVLADMKDGATYITKRRIRQLIEDKLE